LHYDKVDILPAWSADEMLTAFLELQAAIHRRFERSAGAWLHVLLSNQIKTGHAIA
jgi:hypothetical protein